MAEGKKRKYKIIKWISGILLVLLVAIFSTSLYITRQLKPIIKKELKNLIKNSTSGLYNMDYTDVDMNFITGSVTIDSVKIMPNNTIFAKQILAKEAPNNLYEITLPKLLLKNIHLFRLYFGKKVKIKTILFDQPSIKMINKHFDFNDNKPLRPSKSTYAYISKFFKSVSVDLIDFKNAKFQYVNNNKAVPEIHAVSQIDIRLKDWLIDKNSADDTTRLYLLKDINLYVSNYSYATPDSMYYIKVDQLNVAAAAGKVNINKFALEPRYGVEEFSKVAGYAKDRFSIQMNDVSLDSLSFPAYIKKREIAAAGMHISNGSVSVYNNDIKPAKSTVKTGRFPHQLLQKIEELITIKKIHLANINISYAKFDHQSQKTGKITFENTSGTLNNVTNAQNAKSINPFMQVDLMTYVMGQGKMGVNFNFDLISTKGDFSYKGELLLLDGKKLNRITKPLGMLQINKGFVRSLGFDIIANQDVAKGRIDFKYNDLSVSLFKKDESDLRMKRMGLASLLANALIVYSDNPSTDGKYTYADVEYRRKPTGSFFNYIWRTIFEGVKYSVGFSPETQAEIRNQVDKFKQMKADRKERRLRREYRKEKNLNKKRL